VKNGEYILVLAPEEYPGKKYRGMYIYEHHLVYWENTGIIIDDEHEIHHKNEIKTDNRFLNLDYITKISHKITHGKQKVRNVVVLKCPGCEIIFKRRRGSTHLVGRKTSYTCCSKQCVGKFTNIKKKFPDIAIKTYSKRKFN
jgi:uncharacterized C2H2 Zn-finger protein